MGRKVTLTLSLHFHQLEHESVHFFTLDTTLVRPAYTPNQKSRIKVNYVQTSNGVRTPLRKAPPVWDPIREGVRLAYSDEPRIITIDGNGYLLAVSSDVHASALDEFRCSLLTSGSEMRENV